MACSNKDLVELITQKTRDRCIYWTAEAQGPTDPPEPNPYVTTSNAGYAFTSIYDGDPSAPYAIYNVWKELGVNPLFARYVLSVERFNHPSEVIGGDTIDDCSDEVEILYNYLLAFNATDDLDGPSEEIDAKNQFDQDFLNGLTCDES